MPAYISRFTNALRFVIKCGTDIRTLCHFFSTVLVVSLQIGCALAAGNAEPVQRRDTASLYASALGEIRVEFSEQGNVAIVRGSLSNPVSLERLLEDPYGAAEAFFRKHAEAFGVEASITFVPDRERPLRLRDDDDFWVQFRQSHDGVRVLYGRAGVRYTESGTIKGAYFHFDIDIQIANTKPTIDEARARELAVRHIESRRRLGNDARVRLKPELVIYPGEKDWLLRGKSKSDLLAWLMLVGSSRASGPVLVLDANSGRRVEVLVHVLIESNANRKTFNLDGMDENSSRT